MRKLPEWQIPCNPVTCGNEPCPYCIEGICYYDPTEELDIDPEIEAIYESLEFDPTTDCEDYEEDIHEWDEWDEADRYYDDMRSEGLI